MRFLSSIVIILLCLVGNKGIAQKSSIDIYRDFDKFSSLLETENDTTYIVNFWATWCKPCIAELPYFAALEKKYGSQKVKLILVSLDLERQIEKRLIPFIEKNKIESKVVLILDPNEQEWIDKVDPSWSGAIPITIIYNKNKRIFLEEEFDSFKSLEREFLNIFNN